MMKSARLIAMFAIAALFVSIAASAVETHMVTMRDGKRLATNVHLPDAEGNIFPVILTRTTYGREGGMNMAAAFTGAGYVFVVQDTRGRGGSEGIDRAFADDGWGERQDGADTIDWILEQDWCNGKVGTWGGSALGITQVLAAGATQDITAQAMVVAAAEFYGQLSYQGGVFRKRLCEGWLTMQESTHVIDTWKAHPAYDDFWRRHDAVQRASEITAAGVHMGGWFDIFGQGTIDNFVSRQEHGGEGARGNQKLIMGPWIHGAKQEIGDLVFPDNFNFNFNDYQMRFYEHWLEGTGNGIMDEPAVHYYVMGDTTDPDAPGNEWRTADTWPPYETKATPFYLGSGGELFAKPENELDSRTYTYDPADPCPTHGGANLLLPAGPYDQREVSGREDVLTFVTEPLGKPLEIAGPVSVRLWVSSNAPDTDFTAKLVDVYPDGKQILIQDNIQRVKFRNGFEEAEPLPPGDVGALTIDLWTTALIFNEGHRIALHISSSNFPRFEINPNTGDDFPTKTNMNAAKNTVYFGGKYPSALMLPLRATREDTD